MKVSCDSSNFKYLLDLKSKLSKGKEICHSKFETQVYFKSGYGISSEDMRWIYALRCRTLPLKCNAPSQHTDSLCLAQGCLAEDRNEHVYRCKFLADKNQLTQSEPEYDEIFSNYFQKQL